MRLFLICFLFVSHAHLFSQVLQIILSGESPDAVMQSIHTLLQGVAEKLKKNEYDLKEFIVNKGLTKDPKDYPDASSQPHVQVAQRICAQVRVPLVNVRCF